MSCLRYCKSTIFQANHNKERAYSPNKWLFAILQKYDFSSKSQPIFLSLSLTTVVCDTAKVRFFKQITTPYAMPPNAFLLFAILQKYDFSSKSQRRTNAHDCTHCCLRYCKSTIFQANHNQTSATNFLAAVVCDTAKVRFFKQITTYFALK